MRYAELTPRQLEVLRCFGKGLTRDETAAELNVSSHTVKFHSEEIRKRLDVPKMRLAVQKAREMGLL